MDDVENRCSNLVSLEIRLSVLERLVDKLYDKLLVGGVKPEIGGSVGDLFEEETKTDVAELKPVKLSPFSFKGLRARREDLEGKGEAVNDITQTSLGLEE